MDQVLEILREAAHEIVDEPLTFAIEVAQFAVLVLLIKAVAFGTKKRAGMVTKMLRGRTERIARELEAAAAGHAALAAARDEAVQRGVDVQAQATAILREGRKQAKAEHAALLRAADEQAAATVAAAHAALQREREELLRGVSEQLVEVVTAAARQVLERGLSESEQRIAIEKAIVAGIEGLEQVS